MKNILFVFFVLFLSLKVNAQQFTGTVLDKNTKEPIPFVEILLVDLNTGTTSNLNGIFKITHFKQQKIHLQISYIGYTTLDVIIDCKKTLQKTFFLEESHYQLEEIVVSAPIGKLQKATIVAVKHKKLAILQQTSPITLAEAISNIAGVEQNTTGAGIGKPIIRGLSGSRIVTYAQGIRIENQQWGDEHGLGVGEIGIGSVEVIKGPASLLYGADALGGVLYFVDERYAKHNEMELNFQSKFLSNTLGYSTGVGIKIHKEKFRWNLFGEYSSHADYQIPKGKRVDNTRFNEKNIKTSFGFNTKNWISNIRYSFLQNYFGIAEDASYSNLSDRNFKLPFQIINNHNLSFENNITLNKSKLKTSFGFTSNYRREFEDDKNTQALGMFLNTYTYNAKWLSPLYADRFDVIIGSQGMYQTNTNNGEEVLIPNATTKDIGVYALGNISINQLHFQTGIRIDNRRIDAKTTQNIGALQKTYQGVTFSAGVVYQQEKTKWRANISNGFRAPTTSELLSDGVHEGTNRYEKGNTQLANEKATQFDVEFDYTIEHLQLSINPFYNMIKNYVFLSPTNENINNNPVFKYLQTNAFLYGGELGIHYHPHQIHWLHFKTDFSTVFAKDTSGKSLPLIPQSKINTTISASFSKVKNFGIKKVYFQHIYKMKQTHIGLFETPTSGYSLINVGLNLEIKTKTLPIEIFIGIKNLLNTTYIDHLSRFKKLGAPNQGINFYVSLKFGIIQRFTK